MTHISNLTLNLVCVKSVSKIQTGDVFEMGQVTDNLTVGMRIAFTRSTMHRIRSSEVYAMGLDKSSMTASQMNLDEKPVSNLA